MVDIKVKKRNLCFRGTVLCFRSTYINRETRINTGETENRPLLHSFIEMERQIIYDVVLEYSKRFPDANIIWVTSDRYFAGTAMRSRVCDFVERPYEPGRIGDSITKAVNNCSDRYEFQA